MGLGFNTAGVVDLEFDTGGCIDLGFIIGVIELQLETPGVEVLQTGDESSLEDAFTRWLLPEAATEWEVELSGGLDTFDLESFEEGTLLPELETLEEVLEKVKHVALAL